MIQEEFISYLWENCLLAPDRLQTDQGESLTIIHPGNLNHDAGPDFLASRIRISDTIWVGNSEIHVKASDWYTHRHHLDPAYDNVILHVVYQNDKSVRNSKGKVIPTLEVNEYVDSKLLTNYLGLKSARHWIPCQNRIEEVEPFTFQIWLSRLLIERLERKTQEMFQYLDYFSGNWEETFFYLLAKNFGFKVNAVPFGMLMQRTPLKLLMRNTDKPAVIESILFGQSGLLNQAFNEAYPLRLKKEYLYQCKIHKLQPINPALWKFSRMRPGNFPTLRIAQFARLFCKNNKLFSDSIHAKDANGIRNLYKVAASSFWDHHYTFHANSRKKKKILGDASIDNIMINTIIPLMFLFGKEEMKPGIAEKAIDLLHGIKPEKNQIVNKWAQLGVSALNAADTQALIELKKQYCTPRKCLNCRIGNQLIKN